LMYRDRGPAPIGMTHDVMAAGNPGQLEPSFSNARTTRSPRTDGIAGIRLRRP
jgi:hypothetical protein